MSLCEFVAIENVTRFADPVLVPRRLILLIIQIGHDDTPLRSHHLRSRGRHPDHSDTIPWSSLSRFNENGRQELREKKGAQTVRSELGFVILFRFRALRWDHHTGIVPQNVESGFLGKKRLRGVFHLFQIVEIQVVERKATFALRTAGRYCRYSL